MHPLRHSLKARSLSIIPAVLACLTLSGSAALAQNCQTSTELDAASRTAITNAGQRFFDMASKGDAASLQQNAIASLTSNFSAIQATVKDHQKDLAGSQATVKSTFLLEAEGTAPIPNAQFYCGVFGKNGQTTGSAVFTLANLPPGKYGVVILKATSADVQTDFALILQQVGTDWKLGGLYVKGAQIAGHDSDWYVARAREYKSKGQLHNAWLYYIEARSLISPLPFMSTLETDKLYDESQGAQPTDVPANGKTADLTSGAATYRLTEMFPEAVGNDLDVIVRYQAADISNTTQTYQNNVVVIKALVGKYPELRSAFAGVVARAVDASGRDYGTMLAMKDIK